MNHFIKDPSASPEKAAFAARYLQNADESQLAAEVRFLRVSKCWDANAARMEIAFLGNLKQIEDELARVLIKQGARCCSGAAPRSPLEREIKRLL